VGGLTADINETARGFANASAAYVRGRPSYPHVAIDLLVAELGVGPGTTVVDLAAGTGKFTALVLETGANVVAVEPIAEMRAAIAGAEALEGTAESIPLPDGAADAVTVAQAFHWFRPPEALAEIARALRPNGGLAMLWNRRDESVEWVRRMSEVLRWHEQAHTDYELGRDWRSIVADAGLYTPLKHRTFAYEQVLDRAGLADRVRSMSYIAAMGEVGRESAVASVLDLVADQPDRFALPYTTHVYWCRKRS
jgi:SAM-dependent methyltransferase